MLKIAMIMADDAIRLGFCVVNGLQREHADDFLRERKERSFSSLEDFRKRALLTKDELRALANLGALNCFAEHRRAAMWKIEETPHDDLLGKKVVEALAPRACLVNSAFDPNAATT